MIKELRHIQLHDMMSYLKAVVASLVLCFTIQGCDKEMGEPESTIDDNFIGFNAGVEKTRAIVGSISDVKTNGGFAVWGSYTNTEGTLQKVFNGENVYWEEANGSTPASWKYDATKYWNSGKTYNFFAVYPHTQTGVSYENDGYKLDFTVPYAANVDLLVAKNSTNATKDGEGKYPTVAFDFKHALSKVAFKIKKSSTYNENDVFIVTQVGLDGISRTGTLTATYAPNSNMGTFVATSESRSVRRNDLNETLTTTGIAVLGENEGLLVMPQSIKEKTVKLYLTYTYQQAGDTELQYNTLSVDIPTETVSEWETSKSYMYNLELSIDNTIYISTPTITDWGSKQSGGTIIIR